MRWIVMVVWLAALGGCSGTVGQACISDRDCDQGQLCEAVTLTCTPLDAGSSTVDAGPDAKVEDGGDPASMCVREFVPPGSDSCPDVCTGGCTDANVCMVSCSGEEVCAEDTIPCPDGYACGLVCEGRHACDDVRLICNADYACTMRCTGEEACRDADVECGNGSCRIDCGDGSDVCDGFDVACDDGACSATCASGSEPSLDGCSRACACREC